ncbi:MAG: LacI family DNA-binding transcriptional regulator [Pedobacter sp.]|nr:MAG: LacI family DNA-binding transcriptional regulator [Pedobacter sp.]
MPRVKCKKCQKDETIIRSGFIRGRQRFFCKECDYYFTIQIDFQKRKASKRKDHSTTIIDIAKAIGVSISTVSRALKDHSDISQETKNVVKQVAAELNYQPNTLAQSLTRRETRTIGVIIPDIETYFFASILTGIQSIASAVGYKVMISQSRESHETEVANVHTFITNWVDGLLICHSKETTTFDHIKLNLKRGIPIIQFDRVCEELNTSKVLLDDVDGSFQVTEHMIGQGFKRIAIIVGPERLYVSKKRLEGYLKALKKSGIDADPSLIRYTDLTKEAILKEVDYLLETDKSIDAFFCISDMGAVNIIVHLKKKGIRIPQDIGVAGFGNDPTGEIIEPSLTSFNPETYKCGEVVAQMFFDQILDGDDHVAQTKTVKGNLILRSSTLRNHKI